MAAASLKLRAPRAMSQAEKADRSETILIAADELLRQQGTQAFTMDVLASRLEIARATLYRYFANKEEILLALWEQKSIQWVDALMASINKETSDDDFLQYFYAESLRDPLFIQLRSLLETIIVHRVGNTILAESRQRTLQRINELAAHCAECLSVSENDALHLIVALGALILGGLQIQANPVRKQEQMTERIALHLEAQSLESLFFKNALYILEGIRRKEDWPVTS